MTWKKKLNIKIIRCVESVHESKSHPQSPIILTSKISEAPISPKCLKIPCRLHGLSLINTVILTLSLSTILYSYYAKFISRYLPMGHWKMFKQSKHKLFRYLLNIFQLFLLEIFLFLLMAS